MATGIEINETSLERHSFDLVHFPMCVDRNGYTCVRFTVVTDFDIADVVGYYIDTEGNRAKIYVKLVADPVGVSVHTDQFFHDLHGVFQNACLPSHRYIGFTRCGKPMYAPLFALAMLYKKYGRGLYGPGNALPTPCAFRLQDTNSGFNGPQMEHLPERHRCQ